MSYIDREKLIAEYDRVHKGPPGGARKLMIDALAEDVIPVEWIHEQIREQNFDTKVLSRMLRAWRAERNETDKM